MPAHVVVARHSARHVGPEFHADGHGHEVDEARAGDLEERDTRRKGGGHEDGIGSAAATLLPPGKRCREAPHRDGEEDPSAARQSANKSKGKRLVR